MSKETQSRWWDRTINPFVGCTKLSEGCAHCWAERMARTRLRHMPTYADAVTDSGWTGNVVEAPGVLTKVSRIMKGIVFVSDMGDIFHNDGRQHARFTALVQAIAQGAERGSTARFCVLTKRAEPMQVAVLALWQAGNERLQRALRDRLWMGVSIENRKALSRASALTGLPVAGTFLSIEPLLESLGPYGSPTLRELLMAPPHACMCVCGHGHGFTRDPCSGGVALDCHHDGCSCIGFLRAKQSGIDWIVVGAETGPGARALDIDWMVEIVRDARQTGTPLFVKQVGPRPTVAPALGDAVPTVLVQDDGRGADPVGWPAWLRIRERPVALTCEVRSWKRASARPEASGAI
jgi:protein gp37